MGLAAWSASVADSSRSQLASILCSAAAAVMTEHKLEYRLGDSYQLIKETADSFTTVHNVGNYLVAFNDPVHALVLREEFERDRPLVEANEADLKLPSEALAAPKGTSPAHLLVGLYARARLFADLRDRRVHRTIEPDVSST